MTDIWLLHLSFCQKTSFRGVLQQATATPVIHFLVITLLKDTFIKINWCLLTNVNRITFYEGVFQQNLLHFISFSLAPPLNTAFTHQLISNVEIVNLHKIIKSCSQTLFQSRETGISPIIVSNSGLLSITAYSCSGIVSSLEKRSGD